MLEHLQPIHPRQGQVEDRHVIFKLAHHELRFITVLRNVHGVLLGFQSLLYETGHRFVVFCYEDSHLLTFSEGQTRFGPASVSWERQNPAAVRLRCYRGELVSLLAAPATVDFGLCAIRPRLSSATGLNSLLKASPSLITPYFGRK